MNETFQNITNDLVVKYLRMWPTRGDQTFELSLSYGVTVGLTALAGGTACILLFLASCGLCCCRNCKCCPNKCAKCITCCFNLRRRRGRKQDHARLNAAYVSIAVFFFAVSIIGLFCSFYGLLQTMQQLRVLLSLVGSVSRVAVRLLFALQDVFRAFVLIVPDLFDFVVGLVPYLFRLASDVVGIINSSTNLTLTIPINENFTENLMRFNLSGVNLTGTVVGNVTGNVENFIDTFLGIACLIPQVANATNLAILAIIIIGEGLSMAGSLICIAALLRSKRPLLMGGLAVLFAGSAACMACFGISTPLSVWVDDLCFTVRRSTQ